MKIIFSRKGFDAKNGGKPSPIINGKPYSLPIPKGPSKISYGNINTPQCKIVSEITKNKISLDSPCHLDPDIDSSSLDRLPGWRGAYGQDGSSAKHLDNERVGPGDLFLFFGWFRELAISPTIKYMSIDEHRIFGWLQIEEIVYLNHNSRDHLNKYPWLKDHPHVETSWINKVNNRIYIARENLSIPGCSMKLSGYGLFSKGHTLSVKDGKTPKSVWNIPDWMNIHNNGTGLSCHGSKSRWLEDGRLRSVGLGQEFVADIEERNDALGWINNIFLNEKTY